MPEALGESLHTPPEPRFPPRKPWTREECQACEHAGLWQGQHYELVEGELIDKMGKNMPHVFGVRRVRRFLEQAFGWERVLSEAPIGVAQQDYRTSEPEPDVYLLREPRLAGRQPGPSDLALVVEISDTSLAFDLGVKAALYARAGIAEYWALDLNGRRLIVHRSPSEGVYKSVTAYNEHERIAPLAAPEHEVPVADLLG